MITPVIVDDALLRALSAEARDSARGRMNHNLHVMDDAAHRLLNATEPRTYVQPHRHLSPPRCETLSILSGRGAVVCFDDHGAITKVALLGDAGGVRVIELPAGCWHTLVSLKSGTVWFEVKEGPYVPPAAEDRAAWAPAESDPVASAWLVRLRTSIDTAEATRPR